MPLDTAGNIVYRDALEPGGILFQADPPVCSLCKQGITRETMGRSYSLREERTRRRYEVIECTMCTGMRDGGTPLLVFLERHNL